MVSSERTVAFFGCPLDCDEKHDAMEEKRIGAAIPGISDDPLDGVLNIIRREVPGSRWRTLGSLAPPDWLRPMPAGPARRTLLVDDFIAFMDKGGCRDVASDVETFVSERMAPPHLPLMVAVDHSLTGGVFKALATRLGSENLSLIVLDSHTDAIPMPALAGAIQYDIDTNPGSVHDRGDPFLYNRPDSYNASTFLHHLLAEEILAPENLYLFGVSDFPSKKTTRIKDPRIARYVGAYTGLKRRKVKIVTKKECVTKPGKIKTLLRNISTPFVYISIDMDIGARNALEGVRFRNWKGLSENRIYGLIDLIRDFVPGDVRLAGMDITEINPRRAGGHLDSGHEDRTYRIAANLIKRLAFNMEQLPRK